MAKLERKDKESTMITYIRDDTKSTPNFTDTVLKIVYIHTSTHTHYCFGNILLLYQPCCYSKIKTILYTK